MLWLLQHGPPSKSCMSAIQHAEQSVCAQVYIPPIDKDELIRDLRAAIGSDRICDPALSKVRLPC